METKTCCRCGRQVGPKPITEFSFKDKVKGTRSSNCKTCQVFYHHQHYLKHKKEYISKAHKYIGHSRATSYSHLAEHYKQNPCVDCGENDFVVCQSDHIRGKKTRNISTMISKGTSWEKIEEELKKCVTRCANCHMRKTAKERDWYKDMVLSSSG